MRTWMRRAAGPMGLALAVLVPLALAPGAARAAEPATKPTKEGLEFFEKKIRPVLVKECASCHSGSVQARGGLRVDTRIGLLIGGQSGPSIVSGKPEKSKLLAVLNYEGPQMPPAKQLPAEVIADFKKWIEIGAPDPRGEEGRYVSRKEIDYEAEWKSWLYSPTTRPAVPQAKDAAWAWSPIDHFVRAKQEATGTRPVADAEPLVWLRRVTFDLVGLPPTLAQIAAIEKDSSRAAREKLVDDLLASPGFGERWGRHWLDVARFAESTGKERNFAYAQAWRYRDWVIDAVNADKPYDQFLREQIAGDLLPAKTLAERDVNLVATGYLAIGPRGINERNRESFLLDIADEQIENVGRGVLGLSLSCARCHDHKFDPITMADYYALAGIFRSTDTRVGIGNRQRQTGQPALLLTLSTAGQPDAALVAEIAAAETAWRNRQDDLRRARQSASAEVLAAVAAATPAGTPPVGAQPQPGETEPAPRVGPPPAPGSVEDVRSRQQAVQVAVRKLDELKGKLSKQLADHLAIGVADYPTPQDINIRLRGEADNPGPVVPRGFPKVVRVKDAPAVTVEASGRRELADWLTRPDHPLTARVLVNRLWAKLFGVGIVPTLDDFGDQGEKATNPELLDYLATRFVERGWSIKKTLRELVLSRTYQLANADDEANLAKDEANASLWRWNRKRLEGEAIRDAILSASGRLDPSRPKGSPVSELGLLELGQNADFAPVQRPSERRSVYLPVLRGKVPEALGAFDLPDPSLVSGQREVTTSAGQALYLLNSPFALEQAGHLATRLLADEKLDDAGRIDRAYQSLLGRHPTKAESERVLAYLKVATDRASVEVEVRRQTAWAKLTQTLLALPEFRFLF